MSLKSWKKEFYKPVIEGETIIMVEAIKRSLTKWEGLNTPSLKKHKVGIVLFTNSIFDKNDFESRFYFNGSTCSLCQIVKCSACPVYHVSGRGCDEQESEYSKFRLLGNPSPMIELLKKCLEIEEGANGT